eukprot:gnl/TRDRNA2_/TRDRNA2_129954_c0_seq1.p1 gnl/TRDRNA2_/TRDRNA2_129954_c0~~gnl/TRDRNA2_/TRDRNA2_129954_c0_seq1.p1  ORF type:complete len:383 (+),score=32.90 gnl/TRDRNA2_/TRDRNA2_129954_c0_seq1:126-1274(+)
MLSLPRCATISLVMSILLPSISNFHIYVVALEDERDAVCYSRPSEDSNHAISFLQTGMSIRRSDSRKGGTAVHEASESLGSNGMQTSATTKTKKSPAMKQKECVFMTSLVTEDYLPGVLGLYASLKAVHTKHRFVTMTSTRISDQVRGKLTCRGIEIFDESNVELLQSSTSHSSWNYTFNKLNVFGATQYRKIVFLDADMLVLDNLDHLCKKPHMSAVISGKLTHPEFKDLNSGVLVVRPNQHDYLQLVDIYREGSWDGKGDQDVIYAAMPDWPENKELHLGYEYNSFIGEIPGIMKDLGYCLFCSANDSTQTKIKVVHFTNADDHGCGKPWQLDESKLNDPVCAFADEVWKSFNMGDINSASSQGKTRDGVELLRTPCAHK